MNVKESLRFRYIPTEKQDSIVAPFRGAQFCVGSLSTPEQRAYLYALVVMSIGKNRSSIYI